MELPTKAPGTSRSEFSTTVYRKEEFMSKNWSIPRETYDALEKLHIQRSPAIDKAIWAAQSDPYIIIRAMMARLDYALAAAKDKTPNSLSHTRTIKDSETAVGGGEENSSPQEMHEASSAKKPVPGAFILNGENYVRVSVYYPKKTEEAVLYLAGLFKLSYEEIVRLSLEAYTKHL